MWETNNAVASSLVEMVKFKLSEDYFKTYDSKVRKLTQDELQKMSSQILKPEQISWFVVGDKSKILSGLQEVGYEIIEVDPDGNPVN